MSNTQIKIDRISIQSQGIAPPMAQAAVQGLGQELLTGLAQQRDALKQGQSIQMGDLNLGRIRVTNGQDARQLRDAIAASVLGAIAKRCCEAQIATNLKPSDRR
jgi:hypothetical protein